MKTLRAFHGQQAVKDKYVARMQKHRQLDQLIKGTYINEMRPNSKAFRGCAVGCTLHSSNHERYETELGIPVQLAYLHDACFEGLPDEKAGQFAYDFLNVIPVGGDLSFVIPHFVVWLLVDPENGVIRFADNDRTRNAIRNIAALHQRVIEGDIPSSDEWSAARAAAEAAEAAAYAAAYAAEAAAYAAYAAAHAAEAAAYAAIEKIADKLLALLAEAPVPQEA